MWHPPDPEMRRAALAGSPNRNSEGLSSPQNEYFSEIVFATAETAIAAAFRNAIARKAVQS
jgi:hypothetical protein